MDYTQETPDFLVNELVLKIIEKIESMIENGLIKVMNLSQFRNAIFCTDVIDVSECQELSKRNAFGLIVMEVWFALKRFVNNMFMEHGEIPDLRNLFRSFLGIIIDGLNNAINKYKDALSVLVRGKISDALSGLYLALNDVDNVAGQEFRKAIIASLNIIMDNNGDGLITRLRNAGMALLTGIVGIVKPEGSCSDLYQLLNQILEIIQNSTSLLDSLIDKLTQRDIDYFIHQRRIAEAYYAELMKIDLDRFKRETENFRCAGEQIASARNETELNITLKQILHGLGITMSWEKSHDSFDSFMKDKNARMIFE